MLAPVLDEADDPSSSDRPPRSGRWWKVTLVVVAVVLVVVAVRGRTPQDTAPPETTATSSTVPRSTLPPPPPSMAPAQEAASVTATVCARLKAEVVPGLALTEGVLDTAAYERTAATYQAFADIAALAKAHPEEPALASLASSADSLRQAADGYAAAAVASKSGADTDAVNTFSKASEGLLPQLRSLALFTRDAEATAPQACAGIAEAVMNPGG
jgi:hypothetical protein